MFDNREADTLSPVVFSHPRWLILATIVLLIAAIFRLVLLDELPPGLAQDEVLDADIAQFIREGENALFFRHGFGHEPLYHYLAAPFAVLYGDNVLAIRLPSAYIGLLFMALTLRWAKRDYGPLVALVAGAGLAISWWPIIFSRIGIRPILQPLLLVVAMWFWPLRAKEFSKAKLKLALLAGLFLGLSIYSYTAARVVLMIPALLALNWSIRYFWSGSKDEGQEVVRITLRAQLIYATVVLLCGLVLSLPLVITLQANPDLQQRLDQLEGPLTALRNGDIGPVLEMTAATIGVFNLTGDPRWTYSLPHRPLFDPVSSILFFAGLVAALWRWRQPPYLLLPVWLIVTLLPSALSPDAPSTVRLIGALPVVYLFPGIGIAALIRGLYGRLSATQTDKWKIVLASFLILLLAINGNRTVRDGFIRWPQDMETRLRYQSVLREIGRYWRETQPEVPPVVAEVFYEPIDAASLQRSIGTDPFARWIQTGAGVAGAIVWPAGGRGYLYVPEYAPIDETLMRLAGIADEPVYRSEGSPSFAVYKLPSMPPLEQTLTEIAFGERREIHMQGVGQPLIEGQVMTLVSGWLVSETLPEDLAIFIHLVDENGTIITQFDGLDAAAETLQAGDFLLQRHAINLPPSLGAGRYSLRLGLYERGIGQRLALENGMEFLDIAICTNPSEGGLSLTCSLTIGN